MFRRAILFLLFVGLAFTSILFLDAPRAQATIAQEKTIVYYFHGNMRCRTCNKIEAYTKEAITAGFAEELADGSLEIRVVNTDKSENEHFIKAFQLTNRSVVLARNRGEKLETWKNLDRIWLLVRKKEAFQSYIEDETRNFMAVEK